MSGEGIVAACSHNMANDACLSRAAQIARETIVNERAGVLGLAQSKARMLAKQSGDSEAQAVRRALLNFANEVAIGLHREGVEDPAVRIAMKAVVGQMDSLGCGETDALCGGVEHNGVPA